MKNIKVNQVCLVIKDTSPQELGECLAFLIKHRYDVSLTTDGLCYIIEYDSASYCHYGNPINVWVDPEAYEAYSYDDEDNN